VLSGLAGVAVDLKHIPGATFFGHLLGDTKDGFFSDPAYGGNRDMVGWKLIGFPGVPAVYAGTIGENRPYDVEPVDMQGARQASAGHQHHAQHAHVSHRPAPARVTSAPQAPADAEALESSRPSASFSV
jgi:gluconate 2-dehydrogenase gamma chain